MSPTPAGRLRVTDPDTLRNALPAGIGPAKGYGQGLLTLAPSQRRPRGVERVDPAPARVAP
jgi:hypothetical protein